MADRKQCEERADVEAEEIMSIIAGWVTVEHASEIRRDIQKRLADVIYDEQGEGEENAMATARDALGIVN